ncbi:hypothetical protein MK489_05340 [Myxococcota bacterium]|nr:hypothetical protein [Myxococcota bacterium]
MQPLILVFLFLVLSFASSAADLTSPSYRLRGGHINAGAVSGATSTAVSPQFGILGGTLGQPTVKTWVVEGMHRGDPGFWGGATSTQSNQDADEVIDEFDNCTLIANADQRDTDGDGCGNVCDGDYDQNGVVGAGDFAQFRAAFQAISTGNPGFNEAVDANGDGIVGTGDFAVFRGQFQEAEPGPSLRADRDPVACP